jgi:isopentenyl-diphosphate delta-isomerase
LGETFWEWGIPTAASVAYAARFGFKTVFATGGIRSGLDVAKALALGASAGGIARRVLIELEAHGRKGAVACLAQMVLELKTAMLLTGSRDVAALRQAARVVTGELNDWLRV